MKKGLLTLALADEGEARFKSEKIKFLYPLLGKSMLRLVLETILGLKPEKIYVITGSQKAEVEEEIKKGIGSYRVELITEERRGKKKSPAFLVLKNALGRQKEKDLLVVRGDLPLIQAVTLKALLSFHRRRGNSLTVMSAELDNPSGFRRVIRQETGKLKIIDETKAPLATGKQKEVYTGVYVVKIQDFLRALIRTSRSAKKADFSFESVLELMNEKKVGLFPTPSPQDILSINTRYELAKAATLLRERKIKELAESGVTVYDPSSAWIDLDVQIGKDTVIYPSVILERKTIIGKNCWVYPGAHLVKARIGNRVRIFSSTVIEDATVEDEAQVGPFARLRPKTVVRSGARVGNFVEMKNADLGRYSKALHMTYLGDCEVGENANIGAGTITCNFDGVKKHKTIIERETFIGSGTELVAPVRIGKGAYVGAGSTITKNVSPGALAVARGKQVEKLGWARRKRAKK